MYQATTPTFVLTLPNTVDLTEAETVMFSLRQGFYALDKSGEDLTVEAQTVSVYLTQAETLALKSGLAQMQLNWTYPDGSRACSNIANVSIDPNLYKAVI